MAQRHHWQVWAELPKDASQELKDAIMAMSELLNGGCTIEDGDVIMCRGSRAKCLSFYKKHNRGKLELHFGYSIPNEEIA